MLCGHRPGWQDGEGRLGQHGKVRSGEGSGGNGARRKKNNISRSENSAFKLRSISFHCKNRHAFFPSTDVSSSSSPRPRIHKPIQLGCTARQKTTILAEKLYNAPSCKRERKPRVSGTEEGTSLQYGMCKPVWFGLASATSSSTKAPT